jgi:hypothetical protein
VTLSDPRSSMINISSQLCGVESESAVLAERGGVAHFRTGESRGDTDCHFWAGPAWRDELPWHVASECSCCVLGEIFGRTLIIRDVKVTK